MIVFVNRAEPANDANWESSRTCITIGNGGFIGIWGRVVRPNLMLISVVAVLFGASGCQSILESLIDPSLYEEVESEPEIPPTPPVRPRGPQNREFVVKRDGFRFANYTDAATYDLTPAN